MDTNEAVRRARPTIERMGTVRFGDHPETKALVERHSWPRTYVLGRSCVLTEEPLVAYAALGFIPRYMVEGAFERVSQSQSLPDFRVDYLGACHEMGQRIFGELSWAPELADGLERLVGLADVGGLLLAAAWTATPPPQTVGARIERAATILREYRGGLHTSLLNAHGWFGPSGLIVHNLWKDQDPAPLLRFYGWRDESEIEQQWAKLRERGVLASDNTLASETTATREQIEARTAELASGPWQSLAPDDRDALVTLLERTLVALS